MSASDGSQGPWFYDRAWISIERADAQGQCGEWWFLIRRNNAPASSPTTAAGHRHQFRCANRSTSPAPAGGSRLVPSQQDPQRARPALDPPLGCQLALTILATLACTFLAVLSTTERAKTQSRLAGSRQPATRSTTFSARSSPNRRDTGCTARSGDADTNTELEPATTSADMPTQRDGTNYGCRTRAWSTGTCRVRPGGKHGQDCFVRDAGNDSWLYVRSGGNSARCRPSRSGVRLRSARSVDAGLLVACVTAVCAHPGVLKSEFGPACVNQVRPARTSPSHAATRSGRGGNNSRPRFGAADQPRRLPPYATRPANRSPTDTLCGPIEDLYQ
ncbi:hypothetical protein HDA44_003224 [Kribbella solani]|uniref:Uncharacterized protein n=1 Tax=Kribbella solani TaxID=236067 RepID=A0A841DMJ1_9ACTN|nr:hypothetical protein [Kribbella solani]